MVPVEDELALEDALKVDCFLREQVRHPRHDLLTFGA
jgi:hypothetical protein